MWAALLVAIDQLTAAWARRVLSPSSAKPVWGRQLQFQLLYNRGAMLGLGSSRPALITGIGIVIAAGLLYAMIRWTQYRWPLATMAGGGLGNVGSRIVYGRVTDFIRVAGYPGIFNVADVALRVGMVWLVVAVIVYEHQASKMAQLRDS